MTYSCPNCGTSFEPDRERLELLDALEDKFDHGCYRDASFEWMQPDEVYVHLPRDGVYTTCVEDRQLPDPWYVDVVWCKSDKTTVSITR